MKPGNKEIIPNPTPAQQDRPATDRVVSLHARHHYLSEPEHQLEVLEHGYNGNAYALVPFQQQLENIGLYPLMPTGVEIFQVNLGKMCNQVCKHCHVDAGPDRKEIMTRETMQLCLEVLKDSSINTVDLTGRPSE